MERARDFSRHRVFVFSLMLWLGLMGAVLWQWPVAAAAVETQSSDARFMSVGQLREGMKGVAKTVFHGTTIEEFDVEILSVLPDAGAGGDLILGKVSDEVIERAGGVVQGMSGSPVYVDGKLIGAISGAYRNNPDGLAAITPIEDMLQVLDRVQGTEPIALNPSTMVAAKTPLMASGLSSRALNVLAEQTGSWGMYPVEGGQMGSGKAINTEDVEIEPGAALGLQWVRGDVNLTSIGTVTYVDGDNFVAFGHTAGNWGKINAFASTAYVNAIVRSRDIGFKLASPIETVGTVSEDRWAGIAGTIGQLPPVVHYDVRVRDKDSGTESNYQFDVVRSEQFTSQFSSSALLGVLDRGIDRLGPGTSRVVYRVYTDDLEPIIRDNVYYSTIDISAVSLSELLEVTQLLLRNEFKAVDIERVELEVDIDSSRQTATIEKARPARTTVAPGESVNVEVVIRPYRGERETKIIRLDIPENAQPSSVHVSVRGGGYGYLFTDYSPYHDGADAGGENKSEDPSPPSNAESLDKLIKEVSQRPRHQDLVVEFVPYVNSKHGTEDDEAVPVFGEPEIQFEDFEDPSGASGPFGTRGLAPVTEGRSFQEKTAEDSSPASLGMVNMLSL